MLAATTIAGWWHRPVQAAPPGDAEELIRRGNALRRAHKDAAALPLFQQAYESSPTPRTAAQLGLCQLQLGYVLDADDHLSEALNAAEDYWVQQNRAVLETARVKARAQIGEVTVDGGPTGAQVFVNGRLSGTLPLSHDLRLREGPVNIEVRAAGFTTSSATLTVVAGRRERATLNLAREERGTVTVTEDSARMKTPRASALGVEPKATTGEEPISTSRRGSLGAIVRVDSALPLQRPFGVLEPGVTFGAFDNLELIATVLVGHYRGGTLGGRWFLFDRVWKPVLAIGIPMFVVDGRPLVGMQGSGSLQWEPTPHLGFFVEFGLSYFPGAGADLRRLWALPAVGAQLRL